MNTVRQASKISRIGLKPTGIRFKGTAPPPGATFRPLHPLRGGPGIRPQEQRDPGKRSVYGIANKLADYSQRGIVTVLFGMTIFGMYAMWDVHTHIMAKGQEEYEKRLKDGTLDEAPVKSKKPEWTLAEAAQKVQEGKKPQLAPSDS